MATKYADDFRQKPLHTGEHGNAVSYDYFYDGAAAQNDVIDFGIIPAGTRVDQLRIIFEDCGTGVTLDLGYTPAEGSTPAAALTYFFSNLDVATAAGNSFSSALPITFEKDVILRGTVEGAAFTGTPRIDVIVHGQAVGVK